MCMLCTAKNIAITSSIILASTANPIFMGLQSQDDSIIKSLTSLQKTSDSLSALNVPEIPDPNWLIQQNIAEQQAAAQLRAQNVTNAQKRIVTYDVSTKGMIVANIAEFRSQANASLNDSRGWARLGVSFQEVASGGMFTLVLSEASQMTSFSPTGCGTEYSCRVGRYVVINQDRWLNATTSWNQAGGSLRDYRHMVVNHETGHWLGHGHTTCQGAGQPALVMQQQSISLAGCSFNPWPTASELWSTQLGIDVR